MLQASLNNTDPTPATLIMLLNVHDQGSDEYKCGEMNVMMMIQALSVNYVLSQGILPVKPRFNLRSLVLDNCDNPLKIDQDLTSIFINGELCNEEFDWQGTTLDRSTVIGVQTTDSRFVVAANRVTAPLKIQLMSSSATSTALNDRWRYPYFARAVPPDNVQMAIIADILDSNDWSYVGVIYSLESYGISGYRTLDNVLNNGNSSCVGIAEGIDYLATTSEILPHVQNVAAQNYINVIVIVSIDPFKVMQAFIDEGVAYRFVIILTDTWENDVERVAMMANYFEAVIAISFQDALFMPFVNYLTGTSYNNTMGMPSDWFDEFYQHIHECYNPNADRVMMQYDVPCDMNLNMTAKQIMRYPVGKRELMSTYALAESLAIFSNYHGCTGSTFESCLVKAADTVPYRDAREELFNFTLGIEYDNVASQWHPNDTFRFELGEDRYWDIGYDIYSFGKVASTYEQVMVSVASNNYLEKNISFHKKTQLMFMKLCTRIAQKNRK